MSSDGRDGYGREAAPDVIAELKRQLQAETRARIAAERQLAEETQRADIAELALRDAIKERDRERQRAERTEARLRSLFGGML